MKKSILLFMMMMMAMISFAKDIKTVVFTTTPQMHCEFFLPSFYTIVSPCHAFHIPH